MSEPDIDGMTNGWGSAWIEEEGYMVVDTIMGKWSTIMGHGCDWEDFQGYSVSLIDDGGEHATLSAAEFESFGDFEAALHEMAEDFHQAVGIVDKSDSSMPGLELAIEAMKSEE
jgi:hypothetical protein